MITLIADFSYLLQNQNDFSRGKDSLHRGNFEAQNSD